MENKATQQKEQKPSYDLNNTKDELINLAVRIATYTKKEYKDISKERLQESYDRCREIDGTLTIFELEIIWYIRHTPGWFTSPFHKLAKSNYEAQRKIRGLEEIKDNE